MEEIRKPNIILGLDISTTCIGVCLLLDDGSPYGKILELTHVNPKVPKKIDKAQSLFLKTEIFEEEFLTKYKNYGITKCVIEAPLLGSNNTNTVSTLLQFNGMISLSVFKILGIVPNYISSYEARKYAFPDLMAVRKFGKEEQPYNADKIRTNIKKSKLVLFGSYPWSIDKKSVLQEKVADIFPQIQWLYDKKGELRQENYDSTDAFVALLGQMNKERYGELIFKTSDIIEKKRTKGKIEFSYKVKYWDKEEKRKTFVG